VTVSLIKAAEEGGNLDASLHELALNMKRQAAFRDRLRSSMIYPAFIMVLFSGILVLILLFVVPRISKVFVGLRLSLPLPTRVLISASNFLLHNYKYLIAGVIITVIVAALIYHSRKREVLGALMKLPYLRKLSIQIDLARFTHSMSQLLRAGIPIVDALNYSQRVIINKKVVKVVEECKELVENGRPLSDGLENHRDIMPVMMRQLVSAGERTGGLDSAMEELSHHFEQKVRRSLKTFTTLLEPVTLLMIGVMVGGMMLAIMAPMYSMMNKLNPGNLPK
jgi:type IV pilus assembly protein PilC